MNPPRLFTLVLFAIFLLIPLTSSAQTVTYIHTDALGSVVAETDADGNIVERYSYEPYGASIEDSVTGGPGFSGHVYDAATGLSYMQQRYMDPHLGMFLSTDPISASTNPVKQFNRYRYANSNPYRFVDPDGRESGAAFRVINNLTNGGAVMPPQQSPDDWLGPTIGYSLAGILAAPVAGYGATWALANPASAGNLASAAADVAMGDALGGASVSLATVTLFRAVDPVELASLKKLGHFIASPNGDSVKRFVGNRADAEALAQAYTKGFGTTHTVVEGTAPASLLKSAERTPFNDTGKSMESIGIPSTQASKVMCTGSRIKQTSC